MLRAMLMCFFLLNRLLEKRFVSSLFADNLIINNKYRKIRIRFFIYIFVYIFPANIYFLYIR